MSVPCFKVFRVQKKVSCKAMNTIQCKTLLHLISYTKYPATPNLSKIRTVWCIGLEIYYSGNKFTRRGPVCINRVCVIIKIINWSTQKCSNLKFLCSKNLQKTQNQDNEIFIKISKKMKVETLKKNLE